MVNQSCQKFDIYGCNIQNVKVGSVSTAYSILLIQEKFFAMFAMMQSHRNIVRLKGITGGKSTQIRLKNFCMLHNVTKQKVLGYKDQT